MLRAVDEIAYELALPPSLSAVHLVFHVSLLKKYMMDHTCRSTSNLTPYPTYPTRRLHKFSTDLWRLSIWTKCLLLRCFGRGWELRSPRESMRMRCSSPFPDSSPWRTEIQGIRKLPCFVFVWLCVCCVACGCMCTTLGKFWNKNFLSGGGYKTRVVCPKALESVRSLGSD